MRRMRRYQREKRNCGCSGVNPEMPRRTKVNQQPTHGRFLNHNGEGLGSGRPHRPGIHWMRIATTFESETRPCHPTPECLPAAYRTARDGDIDVGKAVHNGEDVEVHIFSGKSVLNPVSLTGKIAVISRVSLPLSAEQVGTFR
ncbi:hypothetical protein F5Y05DRAFT_143985 [Hypoxylon sp. FL0543]|nr:hypothetical protein F5Y05DRAFT_143985 [Hypoxylon sp. FL0543]